MAQYLKQKIDRSTLEVARVIRILYAAAAYEGSRALECDSQDKSYYDTKMSAYSTVYVAMEKICNRALGYDEDTKGTLEKLLDDFTVSEILGIKEKGIYKIAVTAEGISLPEHTPESEILERMEQKEQHALIAKALCLEKDVRYTIHYSQNAIWTGLDFSADKKSK